MTVAELIAELSKIEDQGTPVFYLDREYGDTDLFTVDIITADHGSFGPATPFVRLW